MAAYIRCSGRPSEVGAAHGRIAEKQIRSSIENYRSLFESLSPPIFWSDACQIATKFLPIIEKRTPSAIEEMRAIASAANVSFDDILVLNCRSEFSLAGAVVDGCSAIAYKNPETGKQLLAQNWDWHPNQLNNVIILDITNINGSRIVTITEAGIVGKVGFNSDSVGVTLNGIKTAKVALNFDMLPIHFALRYIVLESPSASEAINQVLRIGIASTAHFLIADSVSAYGIEVSPIGNGVIPADQDGFVLHTNHWVTQPGLVDTALWLPDTVFRLNRMGALKPKVKTAEDVWTVLGDEEGAPGCICRTAPGVDANAELETLFAVVMDLEVGAAEFVHGRPTKFNQRILLPKTGPLGNAGSDVKRQSAWI